MIEEGGARRETRGSDSESEISETGLIRNSGSSIKDRRFDVYRRRKASLGNANLPATESMMLIWHV